MTRALADLRAAAKRPWRLLAISLACLLPLIAVATRLAGVRGVPGSVVFVQQLTLWVAFLGAALAASGDRLLGMSANTFVPPSWAAPVRIFGCGLTAAIAAGLCWASYQFVLPRGRSGRFWRWACPVGCWRW